MSKFKVGDRVRFVGDYTNNGYSNAFSPSRDVFGTVIDVSLNSPIIVFDKNVGGTGIKGDTQHCLPKDLELVTDEVTVHLKKDTTVVHYNQTKIQAIDVIEDWKLDFNLGNVIKYIARADYKGNKAKDLKKAKWYLDRVVEGLED